MKSQRKYLSGIKKDQKHATSLILKPGDLNTQPVNDISKQKWLINGTYILLTNRKMTDYSWNILLEAIWQIIY